MSTNEKYVLRFIFAKNFTKTFLLELRFSRSNKWKHNLCYTLVCYVHIGVIKSLLRSRFIGPVCVISILTQTRKYVLPRRRCVFFFVPKRQKKLCYRYIGFSKRKKEQFDQTMFITSKYIKSFNKLEIVRLTFFT